MSSRLSDPARRVLALADKAARSLNHAYVGTEHLLLGLLHDAAGTVPNALQGLGTDAGRIRVEIEKLVTRGPEGMPASKLSLTPRAKRAIELAEEDARFLQQDHIGPEHLFFGLLREQEGVAGRVLLGLGLTLGTTAECVFKYRLVQLKLVERVVRPLRASIRRKRKMREELLAHVTAIYDEELVRGDDPAAAMQRAAERFGEPAELVGELESSLPPSERARHCFERWIGWRAPETATRWMARLAMQLAALFAVLNVFAAIWMVAALGWTLGAWIAIRAISTMSLLIPILEFVLGALYFKVRDATFGVFGSRKSSVRAALLAMLMGIAVFLTGLSFAPLGYGGEIRASDAIILGTLGLTTSLFVLLIVRSNGPIEIRDALWACLDIGNSPPDDKPTLSPA